VIIQTTMKKSTSWGHVADWYSDHLGGQDTYHKSIIVPNLLRLMNVQKNERILDLACGEGGFSREVRNAGATVYGVDIAVELIEIAKNKSPDIKYFVSSADRIPFITDETIDKISCILALQNIENAKGVFSECARVLRPGGSLYFVLTHPAFRVPKGSSWGYDKSTGTQYRRIDRYLSESKVAIDMHPGRRERMQTVTFHRPLQYYFKLLQKEGLLVVRLEEWISHRVSQRGPRKEAEDTARKEIPLFLFIQAVKK
jgi:ubiquinone/menaquinone biosynthesis C-methylase UbiE